MYTYASKVGESVKSAEIKSFAGKSPFLSLVIDVGQMLPGIGIVSQIVAAADKGVAYVRNVLGKHKKEIYELDGMSADELYSKLPYLFALDMTDNLQGISSICSHASAHGKRSLYMRLPARLYLISA